MAVFYTLGFPMGETSEWNSSYAEPLGGTDQPDNLSQIHTPSGEMPVYTDTNYAYIF